MLFNLKAFPFVDSLGVEIRLSDTPPVVPFLETLALGEYSDAHNA